MKNFIDWRKCDSQCRYYGYNRVAAQISNGLEFPDSEHKTGFF